MNGTTSRIGSLGLLTFLAAFTAGGPARAADAGDFTDAERRLAAPALVDYALLYGLSVPAPTATDADYVLIWLEGAALADPDFAEAWDWIYDLRANRSQRSEAMHALRQCARLAPDNLAARFELLAADYDASQTAEERLNLCTRIADDAAAPAALRAEALRRLAMLHHARGEKDLALRRARTATELAPLDTAAATVLAELEGRGSSPLTQVDLLLTELTGHPSRGDSAWGLAVMCSQLGLFPEAELWFSKAAEILQRAAPDGALPPEFILSRALAAINAGRDDDAAAASLELLGRNPGDIDAGMVLVYAARRAGGVQLADDTASALAKQLRELEPRAIERRDADTCLRIARFHLEIVPDPHRAVDFARRADDFRPGDPAIRETLGTALVATGEFAEAAQVLEPMATTEARAAASLARARFALDDRAGAQKAIRAAEALPAGAVARTRIADVLRELGLPAAPRPDHADIKARLARFDMRILDFPNKPGEYLSLEASLNAATIPLGTPLVASVKLVNRAPFPVTLGDGAMLAPEVGVSLAEEESGGLELNNYVTIPLEARRVLAPGESLEAVRRISASAGRTFLQHQPQRRRNLRVRFVLAPDAATGGARSRLPGMEPVVCPLTRLPVDATEAGLTRLRKLLRSGSPEERFTAVETFLALIVERQEALEVKRAHNYPAALLDVNTLAGDLLAALRDPLPTIRARALAALVYVPLGENTIGAAAPLITDPHWLPRLMAIELFAKRQGPVFAPVLRKQTADEHHLVAALASLYLSQMPQPP